MRASLEHYWPISNRELDPDSEDHAGAARAMQTAMRRKHLRLLYWTSTLLFTLPQAFSALQYLIDGSAMLPAIESLGYPLYFLRLLAGAKLLGIAAIVSGRFPVLKEWAYAGFSFEAIAAILSLFVTGNALYITALPLAFLVVQLLSYGTWTLIEARGEAHGKVRRGVRIVLPASTSAMRGYY
jgi:hypothetical protein